MVKPGKIRRALSEKGFTLVELLVVMVIVAILVGIGVPAFISQRDKGDDADAKAAVRTAQLAIETYRAEREGYLEADESALAEIEPTLRELTEAGRLLVTAGENSYEITVFSKSGNAFTVMRKADDSTTGTCVVAGDAGCPGDGVWG